MASPGWRAAHPRTPTPSSSSSPPHCGEASCICSPSFPSSLSSFARLLTTADMRATSALFAALRRPRTKNMVTPLLRVTRCSSTQHTASTQSRWTGRRHSRHDFRHEQPANHAARVGCLPDSGAIPLDREQRRRSLRDALDQLSAFRQWCQAQQRRQGPAAPTQSSPSSTKFAAETAAALADVVSTRMNSSSTTAAAAESSPWSTKDSSTHAASLPLMERRLLIHHARLLRAVQLAALHVSTADFRHLYAPAVAAAFAPSPPSFFPVPRSAMWESTTAVGEGERGASGEGQAGDAVAQAEQRLAHWAAQWYSEVLQRHSLSVTEPPRIPAQNGEVREKSEDESMTVPPNAVDGEAASEHNEQDDDGDARSASLGLLLLRGAWRQALHHLTTITHAAPPTLQPVEALFTPAALHHRRRVWLRRRTTTSTTSLSGAPRLPWRRATAAVTPAELRLLQHPPSEGLRVLDDEVPTATTPLSVAAVQSSPSEPQHVVKGGGKEEKKKAANASAMTISDVLRVLSAHEAAHGRDAHLPPSCVVRLRRRLWLLQHLPRTLPPSLVHFAEEKRRSRRGGSRRGERQLRHSAAMPHAYLLRSDALEKLPWYPLCVLGQVLEIEKESIRSSISDDETHDSWKRRGQEGVAKVLRNARQHLHIALFCYHPVDYAAVLDYVHFLFVSLGSSMVAHQVAAETRRCGATSAHTTAAVLSMERTFADTAVALFKPPDKGEYAAVACGSQEEGRGGDGDVRGTTHTTSSDACGAACFSWSSLLGRVDSITTESLTATAPADAAEAPLRSTAEATPDKNRRSTTPPSRSDSADITAVRHVSAATFSRLCHTAQQWCNYHRSLYCETLSQVCDSDGIALRELSRMLLQSAPSTEEGRGVVADVVVLAPESAAAITTAVVLQRLAAAAAASPPTMEDDYPAVLFFAVPHDKAYAVASYFKGVFHPSFFQRVCPEEGIRSSSSSDGNDDDDDEAKVRTPACLSPTLVLPPTAWEGSALARLVGRSLRRVDRYPTRTTEAFFARYVRGDDIATTTQQPAVEAVAENDPVTSFTPPLAVDVYSVDLRAAAAHWRDTSVDADGKWMGVAVTKQDDTPCGRGQEAKAGAGVVIAAAPPQLPCGLHAVYKPAHVNCTLHAHYETLVYPLLSRDLPWRGTASPHDTVRVEAPNRSCDPQSNASRSRVVVPSLRQQGLVNRIDVGTSGVVLVARDTVSLHRATDAMVRQHHTRKTYRALVQRWPPLRESVGPLRGSPAAVRSSRGGGGGKATDEAPLFTTPPFLSSLPSAVVCAPVYAAGATMSALQYQQQQSSPLVAQDDQQYSRLHAALHDRRPAITRYRVLEWFESTGVAYVQVDLDSGRRHQIRQHFAQLGFPLLGDARYHAGVMAGAPGTCFGLHRPGLHAYAIDLLVTSEDVGSGEGEEEPGRVMVQVPLPSDMLHALRALRALEKTRKKPSQL
jgi:23S rRNA-/tRNA-specific pseudouridylate synthase